MLTFKTQHVQPNAVSDNPFKGKTIVTTGSFEAFTRDSINTQIEALGAKAGSSVSKNTDFVIVGEKAGSKKAKAESLGITILSEDEFRKKAGL
jgi:DNA ligase (NAD+)